MKSDAPERTRARVFRELLANARPLVSPGVFDPVSARVAESMGFTSIATSGAGLSNALLGQPDIGLLGLHDNVDACRHIARSVAIPVMADADTGYGNAVTVFHAVQYFEEAGVVGINLEDQAMPKRCGHMRGKELIDVSEMTLKIAAAIKAKRDQDFVLNARTDALAVEGIEGTCRRIREYVAAGADMIYVDAIRAEDDIARAVEAAGDTPVNVNMGFGIRSRPTTPLIPLKRLKALGVARVSMPRILTSSAIMGMQTALQVLRECVASGETVDRPDLAVDMATIAALMRYEQVSLLENELLSVDTLARKYGDAERQYLVKPDSDQRN
jgi:2-methylisocitrate lyase-like PEP mutase family enzyme